MKNTVYDMKNTLEGIKSRFNEEEKDQISKLEDKVEKNSQQRVEMKEDSKK